MRTETIAFGAIVLVIAILLLWGWIRIDTLKADFERDLLRIRRR